jgi:hypothetical protein
MIIKNVQQFLAGATLVACAGMALPPAAHANDIGLNTEVSGSFANSLAALPFLNGQNVEGKRVRLVSGELLPEHLKEALASQQGGGALRLNTRAGVICSVVTQRQAEARGLPGKIYYKVSYEDAENMLLDTRAYDFYMAAHEISHCFNHAEAASNRQLTQLASNPAFKQHAPALALLDSSIRETYADFSAVLLGASKTGDWTLFTQGVLPFRANMPDFRHTTLNATARLIKDLDPRMLKGKSFAEINAFANQQFKKNFMNAEGEIDLSSPGVVNVYNELSFQGSRLRVLTLAKAYRQSVPEFTAMADTIDGLGRALYARPTPKEDVFSFISALHVLDARAQGQLARESRPTEQAGERLVRDFNQSMNDKERLARAIDSYFSQRVFQNTSKLNANVDALERWQSRAANPASIAALGAKLSDFIAENVRFEADPQTAQAHANLERRIQGRLNAVRSGDFVGSIEQESSRQLQAQPASDVSRENDSTELAR